VIPMNRYEGDTTTCQFCGNIHYLKNELIIICEKCNYNMLCNLTLKQEPDPLKKLDFRYKKMRVDDLQ